MFVIDELSHAEIAEALNISESTSRSQLFKARKMMQSLIIEDSNTYATV
jgi:RNA polymerase sigma-70 factor (ECF subfamily)